MRRLILALLLIPTAALAQMQYQPGAIGPAGGTFLGPIVIGPSGGNQVTITGGATSGAAATITTGGTGGLTLPARLGTPIGTSILLSGATCNGTADDTGAINTFLAALPAGTTVVVPAATFCVINSANLVVPKGVRIEGSGSPFQLTPAGAPSGAGFIVNPAYSVELTAGSEISNLGVWRKGLTVNPTAGQVVAAVTQWGTENSIGITTDYNGGGIALSHVFVEGFNTGFLSHDGQVTVHDLWGDDFNGIEFDQYPGDRSFLSGVRFEPFYAFGIGPGGGAYSRPGIAAYLWGNNGGGDITGFFSFMYQYGVVFAGNGWHLHNSWVEWDDNYGNGATTGVGLRFISSGANHAIGVHVADDTPVSLEAGAAASLVDIRTTTAQAANPDFYLGGVQNSETITPGGTIAAGQVFSIVLTSASISGSPVTVSYTAVTGDSVNSVAAGLAHAVQEYAALAQVRINAEAVSTNAFANVYYPAEDTVSFSASATGGASLTATSGSQLGGTSGQVIGANPTSSSAATIFELTSNTQWWSISNLALARPSLPSAWITDLSPGTGALTLSGIPWRGVTSSNLSSCGTSPTVNGSANDGDGTITEGTTTAACTLTFSVPFYVAPQCMISSPSGSTPLSFAPTTTALVITNASASGDEFTYHCRPH